MASIISAGTTSGTSLNLSGDTSGVLQLASNGSTTAVTIDTSQNVGIGNSIPSTFNSFANNLVIGNGSSDEGLTIYTGTTNVGTLNFADGTTGSALFQGYIQYVHSLDEMRFFVNYAGSSSFRMSINSNGGVQASNSISVGNATPTTSGAGITFPATQSASSDANTLDDYEEGTFTPTFSASGVTFTYDGGYQTARYTKVGRLVTISFYMGITALSGTTGSDVTITGLPFTAGGTDAVTSSLAVSNLYNTDWPATAKSFSARVSSGGTFIQLYWNDDDGIGFAVTAANIGANGYIAISGTYSV
jgi:hypothetical protein